jgi:perosamine synthetase
MRILNSDRPAILGGTPVRPYGPPSWPANDPSVRSAILALIESGDWGRYHGPHIPDLCRRLSAYHNLEHILPCCGGTAAIELALRGAGVTANDEVIMAGYDFKPNFQNILSVNAVPVLVDLDPNTWQLDQAQLIAAISNRTRAILMSHLHGAFVDAPKVSQIAEAHGLMVIEDVCQCPGAMLYGKRAGQWGHVSVISFGGSKLMTAGRGGAVMTNRTDIYERMKRHAHRGNDAYPLSEIQAAIVCPQLEELDRLNERRRTAVIRICAGFADVPGLTALQLPTQDLSPAYYKVGFRYDSTRFEGLTRTQFVEALRAEGMAFDSGFRGLHLIHGSRRFRAPKELVEASRADAEMVTLYHPVLIENDDAIDELIAAVKKVRMWSSTIQSERIQTA